jgi:hypothetical protein
MPHETRRPFLTQELHIAVLGITIVADLPALDACDDLLYPLFHTPLRHKVQEIVDLAKIYPVVAQINV